MGEFGRSFESENLKKVREGKVGNFLPGASRHSRGPELNKTSQFPRVFSTLTELEAPSHHANAPKIRPRCIMTFQAVVDPNMPCPFDHTDVLRE